VASYFTSLSPDGQTLLRSLEGTFRAGELERFVELLNANRATVSLSSALQGMDSEIAGKVGARLQSEVDAEAAARVRRDELLRRVTRTLDASETKYAVFKTINKSGAVGVDIDVMIGPADFETAVKGLIDGGFYPIDSLSKRYATGFMVKGNPIIVDLHTELTVMGVRYLPSEFLLEKSREVEVQPSDGSDHFPLRLPNEQRDTVARMAHCVIKEGTLSIGDIIETAQALRDSERPIATLLQSANLQLAGAVFVRTVGTATGNEETFKEFGFKRSPMSSLVERQLLGRAGQPRFPLKFPPGVRLLVFFDHLEREGDLTSSIPRLVSSLKFRRNTAYMGHKLAESWGARRESRHLETHARLSLPFPTKSQEPSFKGLRDFHMMPAGALSAYEEEKRTLHRRPPQAWG
jgi:hypothetical protein